jgi:hypothetical protein
MQIHNCDTLFLHISHPITMNGKINSAFSDQIVEPYNQNHLARIIKRHARSLKSKWGIIKHDVAKFIVNHNVVQALQKITILVNT